MGMPWVSCGDYEIEGSLGATLRYLARDVSMVHVGPRAGNILEVHLADLDLEADGVISGPPCPPFSSFGRRLVEIDPRSSVFLQVAQWIVHLARFGRLSFWIIENVCGIRKRKNGDASSFADWFIEGMKSEMPDGWEVQTVEHNSIDCCVPQSRPRVFMIGTSGAMRASPRQRRILAAPRVRSPPVDIASFLDPIESPGDLDALTTRQQINLMEYLDSFQSSLEPGSLYAIVDVERDPVRRVESTYSIGCVRTLRTNMSRLWVLPRGQAVHIIGNVGRLFSKDERCRSAGVVPSSLTCLTNADVHKAIGNTIPVPLIGTVMYPVLRAWIEMQKASP